MKWIAYLWLLLAIRLSAEGVSLAADLAAEQYDERQAAEEKLTEWVREKNTEKRADEIFEYFLKSDDPEEFRRLTSILLDVHFALKRDEIPQRGSGFIGISMRPPVRQRFGPQGFGQGQLEPRLFGGPEQLEFAEREKGVFVDAVIAGTPAEKAGLLAGDFITEIDGESIAGPDPTVRLKEVVGGRPPGTKLVLTLERGEKMLKRTITLMNAQAVPSNRNFGEQPRVDEEKVEQLLKDDYLRWLTEQRKGFQGDREVGKADLSGN